MRVNLTPEVFRQQVDFDRAQGLVEAALSRAGDSPEALVKFFSRYTAWNGYFANGVAILAGMIGMMRTQFVDCEAPYPALADRSNHIASFIFDAARDEFDDRDTAHRDTHRDLAQAFMLGLVAITGLNCEKVNSIISDDSSEIGFDVLQGYTGGAGNPSTSELNDELATVFRGMGWHIGSELLADNEFTTIDEFLRCTYPEMVAYLENTGVTDVPPVQHNCYAWVRIHSGAGNAVEADHFEFAVAGAKAALRYIDPSIEDAAMFELLTGFRAFARHHEKVFNSL